MVKKRKEESQPLENLLGSEISSSLEQSNGVKR